MIQALLSPWKVVSSEPSQLSGQRSLLPPDSKQTPFRGEEMFPVSEVSVGLPVSD